MKKHKFTIEEVEQFYNFCFTPENLAKFNFQDTFQSTLSDSIKNVHEHFIKVAGLKDNMQILDAGCGVGGPSMYFAQNLNVHIEAITISKVQVDILKPKLAQKKLTEKINVTHGDFHNLDSYYPQSYFDRILFLESFGHGVAPEKILKSAYKVLKDDGLLFIKDPFRVSTYNPLKWIQINNLIKKNEMHFKFHFSALNDFLKLLKKNKLMILSINETKFDAINYTSINEYASYFDLNYNGNSKSFEYLKFYEILCKKQANK